MKWAREVKDNITAKDAGVMKNILTIHIQLHGFTIYGTS